jgi:NADPH-dependent curcumin reductase CurA
VAQRAGHARHDGYFGLMDVGQPKPGETVVVSGAAGAVGQTVGQLAKHQGLPRGGHCRRPAKCDWVVKELGFDACIDYKAGTGACGTAEGSTAPRAWTSTSTTSAARSWTRAGRINRGARIIICGAISQYNNTTPCRARRTT